MDNGNQIERHTIQDRQKGYNLTISITQKGLKLVLSNQKYKYKLYEGLLSNLSNIQKLSEYFENLQELKSYMQVQGHVQINYDIMRVDIIATVTTGKNKQIRLAEIQLYPKKVDIRAELQSIEKTCSDQAQLSSNQTKDLFGKLVFLFQAFLEEVKQQKDLVSTIKRNSNQQDSNKIQINLLEKIEKKFIQLKQKQQNQQKITKSQINNIRQQVKEEITQFYRQKIEKKLKQKEGQRATSSTRLRQKEKQKQIQQVQKRLYQKLQKQNNILKEEIGRVKGQYSDLQISFNKIVGVFNKLGKQLSQIKIKGSQRLKDCKDKIQIQIDEDQEQNEQEIQINNMEQENQEQNFEQQQEQGQLQQGSDSKASQDEGALSKNLLQLIPKKFDAVTASLWLDQSSFHSKNLVAKDNKIATKKSGRMVIIGKNVIQGKYSYCAIINKMDAHYIGFGIISAELKNIESFIHRKQRIIYWNRGTILTGISKSSGLPKFKKGDAVTVSIDTSSGIIQWKINSKICRTYKQNRLINKEIDWVPYIHASGKNQVFIFEKI